MRVRHPLVLLLLLLLLVPGAAAAQADSASRSWNRPVAPFTLVGNIHYVGASGVTSFLVTTSGGHVLVDGGFAETAPMILANIRALGFRPEDVKLLLNSHAHTDHAGGLAELKRATGARLAASERDGELLRSGGAGDFTGWENAGFPPVRPDEIVATGDSLLIGSQVLVAHVTAGHTRGCTTWTTTVVDGGREYPVVFHCSTSVPGYRLIENPLYPGIRADYEASFAILASLPCEVFFAPHAGFFQLDEKRARLAAGETPNPFIDPAGCARYVADSERAFRAELARQAAPSGRAPRP